MMRIRKMLLLGWCFLLFSSVYGQEKDKKELKTVEIKTSAVCEMCKSTLEKGMAYEKGVKRSNLDVDSKVLTVWYRADKTTEDVLKKAVTKLGYDADSLPADPDSYKRLNECCKKGFHK